MVLVLVDILGTKARWKAAGLSAVLATFSTLEESVRDALRTLPKGTPVRGGIRSDGLALVFEAANPAVSFATALLRAAFESHTVDPLTRIWLRGVVLKMEAPSAALAVPQRLSGRFNDVSVEKQSDDLMAAINIEQSGIKGARILVDTKLLTQDLKDANRTDAAGRSLMRLAALENSTYPVLPSATPQPTKPAAHPSARTRRHRLADATRAFRAAYREPEAVVPQPRLATAEFCDLLWMVPATINSWSDWDREAKRMGQRARWAARDAGEAEQVAATALVFSEVEAILKNLAGNRLKRAAVEPA